MAKTIATKVYSDEQLAELAVKFGAIPSKLTQKKEIVPAYLTEEEFSQLPYCPRSYTPVEMKSASDWPKIGNRRTYPLSGVLTPEETVAYYAFRNLHKPEGSSTTPKASMSKEREEEINKTLAELREVCKKNPKLLESLEKNIVAYLPKRKVSLVEEMFGVENFSALGGKVTLAYVQFRGPNGEFADTLTPKGGELYDKGFEIKYTTNMIRENLKKLEAQGIILWDSIIDLKK